MNLVRRLSLTFTAGLLGIAVLIGWVDARPRIGADAASQLAAGASFFDITGDRARRIDPEQMDLDGLREAIASDGEAWTKLLATDTDPDVVVTEVDEDDGFERDAPVGVRLAQALHHGTDHRSQICTALTSLGIQPPAIDVWDYGLENHRVRDRMPPGSG